MDARQLAEAVATSTGAFTAFRPVKRVSVAEGAAEALYLRQPGGYAGPWSADETPYMVEPMNMLASRHHEAVCFVGPARTGKTLGLIDAFMAYAVTCDPGDMLIVHMTQEKAREYSKTRVDRAIRHSPLLKARMSGDSNADNTFDKTFKHGMWLKIGWPTVTQLSGSDYRYVVLTDFDRMPDDVDGEGSAFGLALKRTQTSLSRGMCAVESSPGREVMDPKWEPITAHEAPPCSGILGIYNRSNRNRWYWPCPHCDEYFQATPGLGLFDLKEEIELLEIVREASLEDIADKYSRVLCPHCGTFIDATAKHAMNRRGVWVADGQTVSAGGIILGDTPRSPIAGYWLGGVAAAYQSWHSLVLRYLQALREYAMTTSDLALQNTVNTDQGMPYIPRRIFHAMRNEVGPAGRKEKDLEKFIVPDEARFVLAAVDVQGGQAARFIVQVHAVGPNYEQWPIDRYAITMSTRPGVDGGFAPIDPASYPEDWDQLTEMVVKATYRTSVANRELRVRLVICDTGGEAGATDKAYDWYRRCRAAGMGGRVMLIKGASAPNAPLIKESMVGAKKGKEVGDVPLYLLNPNLFKDALDASLKRTAPGAGFYHIPGWLPKAFFDELNAEIRGKNGVWTKLRKRNEAWDLSCYIRAGIVRLGADRIDWSNPPAWAQTLEFNCDAVTRVERQILQGTPAPAARRVATRSSYLG